MLSIPNICWSSIRALHDPVYQMQLFIQAHTTRSTLLTFQSCLEASRSLSRNGILVSLSSVSCLSHHMLLSFAGLDSITWGSYDHSVGHYQQKLLTQVFISCCLDYCNLLLYRATDKFMWQVQTMQNAAARLIKGAKHHDHITPVLHQLHWLPVKWRVEFKIASLVY